MRVAVIRARRPRRERVCSRLRRVSADATPVRLARNCRSASCGRRSGSCRRCPIVAVGGLNVTVPSVRGPRAREHPQQRGLARAVHPDEADHVAGPDLLTRRPHIQIGLIINVRRLCQTAAVCGAPAVPS